MLRRHGFTLIEIVVVLTIIAVFAVFAFPNFNTPTEQAMALNAQNNLLAMYSAQQNFINNNPDNYSSLSYCLYNTAASSACATSTGDSNCGDTLAALNCNLSLNIQDDGTYKYDCGKSTSGACTATRNTVSSTNIVLTLASPINLNAGASSNPQCNTSNYYCP